jgi:hypothetical protein
MNPRVQSAKPLDNYKVLLTFTNGEKKIFDIAPYLNDKFWSKLSDKGIFEMVKVNYGTIEWLGEIDFCPDEVYEKSYKLEG